MKEQPDSELLDAIAEIITAIGSSGLSSKLLTKLNIFVDVNHLSLVHFEEMDKVTYVFSASDETVKITKTMQQLYLSIFYRLDPNKDFLDYFENDNDIPLKRLQPKDIKDLKYRKLWYDKMGVVDRLSILTKADKGLYCLNLFRTKKGFSEGDVATLQELSSVLSSLTIRHTRLSGSLSSFMTRDQQINNLIERLENMDAHLTNREKEVCSRILLGMNSDGIALDLGIKMQSVLTYRKRAYARLNITSQNELFSLCLTTN